MPSSETQALLANGDGNGHARYDSFMQRLNNAIFPDGEPGWVDSSKFILLSSWFNILLVFIPLSIISEKLDWDAGLKFAFCFLGTIPLGGLLGEATEQISMRLGHALGGLLNASFGNAFEIIVGIVALRHGQLRIVQTSMLGSILSNLLLALSMSFLAGGLCFHEQNFQVTAAQTGVSLMTLACITLVIPASYHSTHLNPPKPFPENGTLLALMETIAPGGNELAREGLLLISRGTAIILLMVYIGYLVFQLKTHADLFEGLGEENEGEETKMSVIGAGVWLLVITLITSCTTDILVGSIEEAAENYHVPKAFVGVIILPFVGNAADYATSVRMGMKGKPELTIGIIVGSSIQIATFVIPLLVIVSWIIGNDLTLYFSDFETISLFVSIILVNLLIMDGKSNYMEGLMLCALYLVTAIAFWVS